jgi:hypothetical protein
MDTPDRTTWAVVGTSPSAERFLPIVPEGVTTLATNRAVKLFAERRLDYYFVFDQAACQNHTAEAYEKQATGTRLVTLWRKTRSLEDRNLTGFDVFLDLVVPGPPLFIRGQYTQQLALSGLYSLAFAVNNGAKRVVMLGLEGYENHQAGKVTLIIRPVTQAIIDACPGVQFEFCGRPRYPIGGNNLRIYHNPQDYQATHEDQNAQTVQCA